MTTKKSNTEKTEAKRLTAIEKVRKLMEFKSETGATESEIENAMKLAQKLMIKHNIEDKDLQLTTNDINTSIIQSTWKDGMEARSFEINLLGVLAKTFICKIIRFRDEKYIKETGKFTTTDSYKVVGLEEDRKVLVDTYESLLVQIRNLVKTRYKESDKSISQFKFTTSYQAGFLTGLSNKLAADKEQFLQLEGSRETYGLIVVKKDALIEEFVKMTMSIKSIKMKGSDLDPSAYNKGKEDGSQKNLNKQIGN